MSLEILATTAFTDITPETADEVGLSNTSYGMHTCPFDNCNRDFSSKRNLVDHCRGHHQGKRPHACTYPGCGKSFLRPAHLLIHNRIHTGEKPFVCSFPSCGKRWNQKSALKQHIRSHTGEKPFVCNIAGCNKRFSTSSSCKRHVLTHEKGYVAANGDLTVNPQAPSATKRKLSDTDVSSCSEDEHENTLTSSKRSRSVSPLPTSPTFSSGSNSPIAAPASPMNFQSTIADIAALMPEDIQMSERVMSEDLSARLRKMEMNFILN